MVNVNNLTVTIKNTKILNAINCMLETGRITLFLGLSGAGKTTLLKTLANLITPTEGTITLNNKTIDNLKPSERAQKIGFVFQDFNLFINLTVLENCIDPLIVAGITAQEAKKRALTTLTQVGMQNFIDKYPSELSGGQKQRVAIARALCLQPHVLLLDEPTASLDPENTEILVSILKKLAQEGLTIGVSSQDSSFTKKIIDRAYFLKQGKIIEYCAQTETINETIQIKKFI